MGRGQRKPASRGRVSPVAVLPGGAAQADDPTPSNRAGQRRLPQRLSPPILTSKGHISILSYPELMKEWDYEANEGIDAAELSYGTTRESVAWRCKRDPRHKWPAPPANRARLGSGCPYCASQKIDSTNSLQTLNPELAAEWHPTKNGSLTANDVGPGHSKKVWWRCEKERHEWDATPSNRSCGTGCPYCAGQKIDPTNSLRALRADLAKEWHPTKNGSLTANDVGPGHSKKVWWRCSKDHRHEWPAAPNNRTKPVRPTNCPFCASQKIDETNSLRALRADLAKEWHPTKNGSLTADDVGPGHSKKVWWRCDKGHEWAAAPNTRSKGQSCRDCDRWSVRRIRRELGMLGNLLELPPEEREQQLGVSGLLHSRSRGHVIVEALLAECLSVDDYGAFLSAPADDPADSLIDRLLHDPELRKAVNMQRPPIGPRLRREIYERDNHHCCVCKRGSEDGVTLSIDHFAPHTKMGPTVEQNLWTMCLSCNMRKGNKVPTDEHVRAWLASGRDLPDAYYDLFSDTEPAAQSLAA